MYVHIQILLGTGGGVVKLFDSASSKYLWEVATSDSSFPRQAVWLYLLSLRETHSRLKILF